MKIGSSWLIHNCYQVLILAYLSNDPDVCYTNIRKGLDYHCTGNLWRQQAIDRYGAHPTT